MKRILYFSLCAILIIGSLTACSETDKNIEDELNAYDLYIKMLAGMADVKSIDMEISALNDVFTDSEEYSGYSTGNIKKAANSETGGNDIVINFKISLNNAVISSTAAYYTNGVYYTELSGVKQSFNDPEEKLPFLSHADLLEFPESAVKEFTVSNHNGGKKVEMTLDGNSVISIIEKNQDAEDYNLSDVVCEFIIDENNMLKFHRVISEENMTLVYDDNIDSMKIKKDVSITVNSYNDVKIELPSDLDEYINMDFIKN